MIKTVGHHSNLILQMAFLFPHHDNLHHYGAHHQNANQCRAFPDAIYSGLWRYQKSFTLFTDVTQPYGLSDAIRICLPLSQQAS